MNPWPDFFSTLIWQAMVVGGLLFFRDQIRHLLGRLAHFKVGDTEWKFQVPSADAHETSALPELQPERTGPGGFLTPAGVTSLIDQSGLMGGGEQVLEPFLLFSTKRQRTWLATTSAHLICILDDEATRAEGRMIQWRLSLDQAQPVATRPHKWDAGLVDIGPRKGWLYSYQLHPSAKALTSDVRDLVQRAASGSV